MTSKLFIKIDMDNHKVDTLRTNGNEPFNTLQVEASLTKPFAF